MNENKPFCLFYVIPVKKNQFLNKESIISMNCFFKH